MTCEENAELFYLFGFFLKKKHNKPLKLLLCQKAFKLPEPSDIQELIF